MLQKIIDKNRGGRGKARQDHLVRTITKTVAAEVTICLLEETIIWQARK
jgi:hypothetical protein